MLTENVLFLKRVALYIYLSLLIVLHCKQWLIGLSAYNIGSYNSKYYFSQPDMRCYSIRFISDILLFPFFFFFFFFFLAHMSLKLIYTIL